MVFVSFPNVGSKTFQERCERIRDVLYRNGIEGEPTLAKCKKLKKKMKLKEEIAGLDPSVIIETNEEDGRPKRATRKATKRNYVFDEKTEQKSLNTNKTMEDASDLLKRMKQFVDSDSEYEGDELSASNHSIDPANLVEAIIDTNETKTELAEHIQSAEVPAESASQCTNPIENEQPQQLQPLQEEEQQQEPKPEEEKENEKPNLGET